MRKYINKIKAAMGDNTLPLLLCLVTAVLVGVVCARVHADRQAVSNVAIYQEKLAQLEAHVLTEETREAVGKSPAGGQAKQAVFLSICDTTERARVFYGTGPDQIGRAHV